MNRLIISPALLVAAALLASCGDEAVNDLDRIDAAPVGRVSEDALESPDQDIEPLIENSESNSSESGY